jgi:hypothetical protein
MVTLDLSRHSLLRFCQNHLKDGVIPNPEEGQRISSEDAKEAVRCAKSMLRVFHQAPEVHLPPLVGFYKFIKHGTRPTRYFFRSGLLFTVIGHDGKDIMVTVAAIPKERRDTLLEMAGSDGKAYLSTVDKIVVPYRLRERLDPVGICLEDGRIVLITFEEKNEESLRPRP